VWLSVAALVCGVALAGDAPALKPGDAAPKLAVGNWLKGDPVKELKKGTIYVIECWATWCGPCRQVIPHVTEMQKKHKDVVFIGVNVWEKEQEKAQAFVKEMGDKMDYRVVLDDLTDAEKKGKVATEWLAAAGKDGIPCAFIVDKELKLAWVGHPGGMEPVLEKVVAGTFDPKKEAEQAEAAAALGKRFQEAAQAGDWDKALATLDEVVKLNPAFENQAQMIKFQVLLKEKKDCDAAFGVARKLGEQFKDNAAALNEIAWAILDTPDLPKRDVDLALKLAARGVELTKGENGAVMDTLARAHFEKGEVDKAIELQTKAVQLAGDDEDLKKATEEALAKYKAKKEGK
jgi:thiol-disulfide isomerase/thioredoxin